MRLQSIALTASVLTSLLLVGPWASAADKHDHDHDHRQHGTHVHGMAALNLALEGQAVHIELDSPAANIVGFEHAPASEADQAALDSAVATLKDGNRLFLFNKDAGCRLESARVTSELLGEADGGRGEKDSGQHDHGKKGAYEQDDKHDHHAHDHDAHNHDSHGHHDHEAHGHDERQGETHADIGAAYHFACAQPAKLTQLSVELFEAFPAMEKLKVQYVIENRQGAVELTGKNHVVTF